MFLRRTSFAAAIAFFALLILPAHGASLYVDQSVPSSGDGSSWATALKTIREGIEAAHDGDEVIVAVGTYIETIDFLGKSITVRSTNPADPGTVAMTVIEPASLEVVRFRASEGRASVFAGFTITSGQLGISCVWSSPVIRNNVIVANTAPFEPGAGISCYYSSPLIENNVIASNIAPAGGAIACEGAQPVITDNLIIGNVTDMEGGGIFCVDCSPTIARNRIIGNTSQGNGAGVCCLASRAEISDNLIVSNVTNSAGGGVWCHSSVLKIVGNTVASNSAQGGGAGGIQFVQSSGAIVNCILWGNGDDLHGWPATFSCIEDNEPEDQGEGNIHDNPAFEDPDGTDNILGTADDDYRLSPESPCVDVGSYSAAAELSIQRHGASAALFWDAGMDVLGQTRISGSGPDVGCIEHQSTAPLYLLETSPTLLEWTEIYEAPETHFSLDGLPPAAKDFFRVSLSRK